MIISTAHGGALIKDLRSSLLDLLVSGLGAVPSEAIVVLESHLDAIQDPLPELGFKISALIAGLGARSSSKVKGELSTLYQAASLHLTELEKKLALKSHPTRKESAVDHGKKPKQPQTSSGEIIVTGIHWAPRCHVIEGVTEAGNCQLLLEPSSVGQHMLMYWNLFHGPIFLPDIPGKKLHYSNLSLQASNLDPRVGAIGEHDFNTFLPQPAGRCVLSPEILPGPQLNEALELLCDRGLRSRNPKSKVVYSDGDFHLTKGGIMRKLAAPESHHVPLLMLAIEERATTFFGLPGANSSIYVDWVLEDENLVNLLHLQESVDLRPTIQRRLAKIEEISSLPAACISNLVYTRSDLGEVQKPSWKEIRDEDEYLRNAHYSLHLACKVPLPSNLDPFALPSLQRIELGILMASGLKFEQGDLDQLGLNSPLPKTKWQTLLIENIEQCSALNEHLVRNIIALLQLGHGEKWIANLKWSWNRILRGMLVWIIEGSPDQVLMAIELLKLMGLTS